MLKKSKTDKLFRLPISEIPLQVEVQHLSSQLIRQQRLLSALFKLSRDIKKKEPKSKKISTKKKATRDDALRCRNSVLERE